MKVSVNVLLSRLNIIEIDVNTNIYVNELKNKVLEKSKINVLKENLLFNKIKKKDNDLIYLENLTDTDYEILIVKNFSHN